MILMEGVVAKTVTSLEKANTSIGDRKESDLQFQQWRGEALQRKLSTVVRMVMGDLLLLSGDQQSQSGSFSPHRQEEPDRTQTVSISGTIEHSAASVGQEEVQLAAPEREEINHSGGGNKHCRKRERACSAEREVGEVDQVGVLVLIFSSFTVGLPVRPARQNMDPKSWSCQGEG